MLRKSRPKGLKYNIKKENPSWFKKGSKNNKHWSKDKKLRDEVIKKLKEATKQDNHYMPSAKGKHWKLSKKAKKNIGKGHKGLKRSGWKLSEQAKKSIADGHRGKKAYNWKGGLKRNLTSVEYRKWRKEVFKRDNYTCQRCGARSQQGKRIYLEAHHKKSWEKYPDLRFNVKNGKTLCKKCHNLTKGKN